MKTNIKHTLLTAILFLAMSLHAQKYDTIPPAPCQEMELATDATKKKILEDFITSAVNNRWFINNKGIVVLNIFTDKDGLLNWHLIPEIDDKYKDNPPTKFDEFNGDIILIYESKDVDGTPPQNPNPAKYNGCFEQIIGDRVYIRPAKKGRWSKGFWMGKKHLRNGVHTDRSMYGGGGDIIIIFNKDGSYKKTKTA